jgi:hypothetical protein
VSDEAAAKPIGRNRAFIRIPATIAAPAVPPAASTDKAANCDAPAKTTADITIGGSQPMTGRASTPNETATANNGRTSGRPARTPSPIDPAETTPAAAAALTSLRSLVTAVPYR